MIVFSHGFFLIFLNTRTTDGMFQQPGKQDYFRYILKKLANLYENSGIQEGKWGKGIPDLARFWPTTLSSKAEQGTI